MADSVKPVPSTEWAADGWETFELEGPVHDGKGNVVIDRARVRGIRKTFLLPGATPDDNARS